MTPWQFFHGDGVDGLLRFGSVDHAIFAPPCSQRVNDFDGDCTDADGAFSFATITDDQRNRTARALAHQVKRWCIVMCDEDEAYLWRFALEAAGMSYFRKGTWLRLGAVTQASLKGPPQVTEAILLFHARLEEQRWNGGNKGAFWEVPVVRTKDRLHPKQKPTQLLASLVEDFTDEGDLIADLFSGVATTGVAALGLGRRFVGWEIDEDRYRNGVARLEQPLFDRAVQQQFLSGLDPKNARQRARLDLDRKMLAVIEGAGDAGVPIASLVDLLGAERRTLQRSLDRLRKNGAVVPYGQTSATRWFSSRTPPQNTKDQQ